MTAHLCVLPHNMLILQVMNKYGCLIFDFDGTLADTNVGIVRTFQETFRRLNLPVPTEAKISSTIGLTLIDGFHAALDSLSDKDAEHAAEVYRQIFPEIAFPVITAFPGIVDAIREIHSRGILLAVATSRSHHSLEKLADQIGISQYFEGMYGAEDVKRHKPAPDLVNLILSRHGLTPEETLVIGDAHYDLLMGKAAGCKVCGVTWGNQPREVLESVNPDFIVDRVEDLMKLI